MPPPNVGLALPPHPPRPLRSRPGIRSLVAPSQRESTYVSLSLRPLLRQVSAPPQLLTLGPPPVCPQRDPLTALTTLLDTLDRTISVPLGDILPSLPPVLRDSVRALLESVGDEMADLVEGALVQGGVEVAGAEQVLMRLGCDGVQVEEDKEQRMASLLKLVRGSVAGI